MSKLNRAVAWLSVILIPVLLIIFAILYKTNTGLYREMMLEDHLLEWLTFVFLFLAGIFSLIIAIQVRTKHELYFLFFLIFSICCILFAFEEISWGQRVFNIESPDFFRENSDQRDISFHNVMQKWGKNLSLFGITFDIKTKHITGLTLFVYGAVLSIVALNRKIKNFFEKIQVVIPPPILSFSFLIAALMMIDIPTGEEEEIGELFFSICFLLFMIMEYLKRKSTNMMQKQR